MPAAASIAPRLVHQNLDSPMDDIFSTPPSTPSAFVDKSDPFSLLSAPEVPISSQRRSSKPNTIAIGPREGELGIAVQSPSPVHSSQTHPGPQKRGFVAQSSPASGVTPRQASSEQPRPTLSSIDTSSVPTLAPVLGHQNAMTHLQAQPSHTRDQESLPTSSPCFVHSLLDHGASFSNWLETHSSRPMSPDSGHGGSVVSDHHSVGSQNDGSSNNALLNNAPGPIVGLAKALDLNNKHDYHAQRPSAVQYDVDSSDDDGNSLTKRLAETAVGVRELSKQLGRARVRTNIQSVLIVTKARDNRLIKLTRELAIYLMQKKSGDSERGLVVYVDKQLRHSKRFDADGIQRDHPEFFLPTPRRRSSSSHSLPNLADLNTKSGFHDDGQLRYWTSEMCRNSAHLFDFVVTLGGDGTVLFTSWLFQRIVPPVLPFALGSLGFLTNFDFADYAGVMDSAIDNGIRVNLRMRFTCTVYRAVAHEPGKGRKAVKKAETGEILMKNLEKGGWEALEGGSGGVPCSKDKEIMCYTTRPTESFEVLNDLVVDRGPSPYVSLLELFGDEHHMTTVQADGLTVSTPTGSTAYSLSAGGSLVHPEIPALLITPICPHTLSFRPMLLPDSMELRICVPYNSRSTAWASFDGRGRVELKQGDHIKVTASQYPFPTVCADKQSTDWFHAIARTLKWNERERQKSFVVVEEGPAKRKRSKSTEEPIQEDSEGEGGELQSSDEEDEEEEEEDTFDIDDSSAEASAASSNASSGQPSPTPHPGKLGLSEHGTPAHHHQLSSDSSSDIVSIDRFKEARPVPPTSDSRPGIGGRAPSGESLSTMVAESPTRERGENGDRDHIRAPENTLHSKSSKIPKDRDIDAESMRTPRPDLLAELRRDDPSSISTRSSSSSTSTRSFSTERPHLHSHPSHSATAHHAHFHGSGPPPTASLPRRNHRRHGSVDSIAVPRRAFAAWGLDESDSNASDSDH